MKKKLLTGLVISLFVIGFGLNANALIINGGFEDGNFYGWSIDIPLYGSASVVNSHAGYLPEEGDYFALLKTGAGDIYTTLSQDICLGEDDILEGWAAFDFRDVLAYPDDAHVRIYDSGDSLIATPWVVSGSSELWTAWSWTAASADTYTLEFGVANYRDSAWDSYALFDANVHQPSTAPVPEPATILLVGTGLLGIIAFGRKRFDKKA